MPRIYYLLSLLFCLLIGEQAFSQTNVYYPFPDSGAEWSEDEYTCNCALGDSFVSKTDLGFYYKLTHDTIINSITYHLVNMAWTWTKTYYASLDTSSGIILYSQSSGENSGPPFSETTIGPFREDTLHRVYYRDFGTLNTSLCYRNSSNNYFFPLNADFLLYDFGLKAGDTTENKLYGSNESDLIVGYDSVLVNSNYRKELIVYIPSTGLYDSWCEGIGSINMGLLGVGATPSFNGQCSTYLDCFTQNNKLLIDTQHTTCDTITPYYIQYTAGINTLSSPKALLRLYPNPATNRLTVSSNQLLIKQIEIINILGQIVYTVNLIPKSPIGDFTIDISTLPNGLYLIKATDDNGVLTSKFLKQ